MASTVLPSPNFPPRFGEISNKPSRGVMEKARANDLDTSKQLQLTTTVRASVYKKTLGDYHMYISMLGRFAALIGDYQTATLCDRKQCLANPFPAKPLTIALFYMWKHGMRDEVLKHPETHETIKKVDVNVIMCVKDWNAVAGPHVASAAFVALHDLYPNLTGSYQDPCEACYNLNSRPVSPRRRSGSKVIALKPLVPSRSPANGVWKACAYHASGAVIVPRGNAARSRLACNAYKQITEAIRKEHVVKGNHQLTPKMVQTIRNFLLFKGGVDDLELLTMIILGIKCFLRSDELLNVKVMISSLSTMLCIQTSSNTCVCKYKANATSNQSSCSCIATMRRQSSVLCASFCLTRRLRAFEAVICSLTLAS